MATQTAPMTLDMITGELEALPARARLERLREALMEAYEELGEEAPASGGEGEGTHQVT